MWHKTRLHNCSNSYGKRERGRLTAENETSSMRKCFSSTFPKEGKGLVSLKFLNKLINDTERVHASVVIFTFNNLTQERQGSRLLGWKRQSRTSISKRAPPMFSGGSKVVKLLVPHLSESCTQKGSYEKNSIKFPSSE